MSRVAAVEDLDIGPAVALAPVERGIGLAEELAAVAGLRSQACDPTRERQRWRVAFVRRLDRRRQEPASDGERRDRVGVRHQNGELVAPDPKGTVSVTSRHHEQPTHRGQGGVAAGMAPLVVDPLEVVKVHQEQCERFVAALGIGHQARELLLESPMVAQTGQRVEQRGQASAVVLLAEVIAGGLQSLGRREDDPGEEDHQERQGPADDHDAQQRDDRIDLALTRLEIAEHRPQDDLRDEDHG
jgi:hypothetical protein